MHAVRKVVEDRRTPTASVGDEPVLPSAVDRVVGAAPYALLAATVAWVAARDWGRLSDPDSWWHLRLGEDFLDQHSFSPPAGWSSFATTSWVPTEPLPEAVVATVHHVLGLPGVVWLYVASVVGIVACVHLVCRRYAGPLPAVVATMLCIAAGQGSLTPRPQLVSFVLLPVLVEAWRRTELDLRPRWWLVPLCWFWSLCHGFWFIGVAYGFLGLIAVVLGRRAGRKALLRLGALAVACFGVVLLNPLGPRVIEGPFEVSQSTRYITEWARPGITHGPALAVTAMVLVTATIWLTRRREVTWLGVGLLASALFWDWYSLRTIVLGALLAAPLLAGALESLLPASADRPGPGTTRSERRMVAGAALALLVVVGLVVPRTADRPGAVPTALDPFLDRLPAGTAVYNAYGLGGWITWRHPDLNQYIDGLITPYSSDHIRGYYDAGLLRPGWYATVRDSGAPVALLESRSALAAGLEQHGWRVEGTDAGYVLLSRP